jgi:sRNA-binding protein
MSFCIALVPSRASAAWDRCPRRALRGDRFCSHHRTALDGAVMGLLDSEQHRHAQIKRRNKLLRKYVHRRKKKRRAKASAEANAEVHATRTPVREIRVAGSPLSAFFGEEIEMPSPRTGTRARTPAD